MIAAATPLSDVAAAVASALRDVGYDPVVVGGSACTMHAPEAYRSLDIDMVVVGGIDRRRDLIGAMRGIGFKLVSSMFVHAENPHTVEFVPSPVAIGNEIISEFSDILTTLGVVRVLTATDAVCDRLNKYVVWSDRDSLLVAVEVAKACDIDVARVAGFLDRQAREFPEYEFADVFDRFASHIGRPTRRAGRYSFSTIVELRFAEPPTKDVASATAAAIRTFLDDTREAISDLVAVGGTGTCTIEGHRCLVAIELHHDIELPFVERLQMAVDAIDHLRSNSEALPSMCEVVDDRTPPVASTSL